MSHNNNIADKRSVILEKLDELIVLSYRGLKNKIEENAKVGDFIKMFEMRMKLTPSNEERTKFWRMLDDVRKEALPVVQQKIKNESLAKTNKKIRS